MRAAVAETVERFGGLDVAIANAGIAPTTTTTIRMVSAEEWERVIDINLLGVWRTVRAVAAAGRRAPGARRRHLLRLRVRQRHAQQRLRDREVGGRGPRPLAAGRADAAWRERQRRLLRLRRHEAGPGRLRQARDGDRLQETCPSFLLKRITPDEAGAAVVRGIEERAPRIFAPKWWRYVSALRGVVNPLLDRRVDSDPRVREAVREAEALTDEQGAAAASAASR